MKNIYKKAFTLAEVLITLTIIGVIAAVTVPTLTKKTGNQEIVTRLQKVYSVLSQATDEIIFENGSPKNNWAASSDNIYNLYKEHLRNAKDCAGNKGCWSNGKLKYLNGNDWVSMVASGRRLILADGILLRFDEDQYIHPACNLNWAGGNNICTVLYIDVNGVKAPNTMGRDNFIFFLKQDGLYPGGCLNNSADCNSNGQGLTCACKVLDEGTINY